MSETKERLTGAEIKAICKRGEGKHIQFFFKRPPKGTRLDTRLICTRAVVRDQNWFFSQKVDK